ncbi:hypothetical protein B5S28_g4780 [[Candida] boidinii]|nr:hypothetical protein B5S28_g4780 [[Candida] boidinii]
MMEPVIISNFSNKNNTAKSGFFTPVNENQTFNFNNSTHNNQQNQQFDNQQQFTHPPQLGRNDSIFSLYSDDGNMSVDYQPQLPSGPQTQQTQQLPQLPQVQQAQQAQQGFITRQSSFCHPNLQLQQLVKCNSHSSIASSTFGSTDPTTSIPSGLTLYQIDYTTQFDDLILYTYYSYANRPDITPFNTDFPPSGIVSKISKQVYHKLLHENNEQIKIDKNKLKADELLSDTNIQFTLSLIRKRLLQLTNKSSISSNNNNGNTNNNNTNSVFGNTSNLLQQIPNSRTNSISSLSNPANHKPSWLYGNSQLPSMRLNSTDSLIDSVQIPSQQQQHLFQTPPQQQLQTAQFPNQSSSNCGSASVSSGQYSMLTPPPSVGVSNSSSSFNNVNNSSTINNPSIFNPSRTRTNSKSSISSLNFGPSSSSSNPLGNLNNNNNNNSNNNRQQQEQLSMDTFSFENSNQMPSHFNLQLNSAITLSNSQAAGLSLQSPFKDTGFQMNFPIQNSNSNSTTPTTTNGMGKLTRNNSASGLLRINSRNGSNGSLNIYSKQSPLLGPKQVPGNVGAPASAYSPANGSVLGPCDVEIDPLYNVTSQRKRDSLKLKRNMK